ncbi:5-methyltetrahydropteroyltriglutamate--homocysteine S-methyltransferase [Metabacillus sp. RGM 3146]|uniref:5-methyltetrahydropteroyltriglutamate-- homocysteine S-methyltransferase n=1 Tax=Metabacillus sp. RGM 3146 TaxID=3401092 RepID=UPI003B994F8D
MKIISSNQGYPRLWATREWKKCLEAFWKNELSEIKFREKMKELRLANIMKQKEAGISLVPSGDFTFYDQMLDTAFMFNIIPKRHRLTDHSSLKNYFSMARGSEQATACAMTKWFDTNYHYLVPEWEDTHPELVYNKPLYDFLEAKEITNAKPVMIGPYTFIKLSKGVSSLEVALNHLLPLYNQCIHELEEHGADVIQLDEPAFVLDDAEKDYPSIHRFYAELTRSLKSIGIMVQTYFEEPSSYQDFITLPVQGYGLDFTRGSTVDLIKKHGFPADKWLGAGLIDGRNIWRIKGKESLDLLYFITSEIKPKELWIQPSCSLIHVPESLTHEENLPVGLKENLSFAEEKLKECAALAESENNPSLKIEILEWDTLSDKLNIYRQKSSDHPESLLPARRMAPFSERAKAQDQKLALPILPTTTIGSFPQTKKVRNMRRQFRKNEITKEEYDAFIREETARWIATQEELGLDVLVHGEFERNDMVEFFGESLSGFAFTSFGWVQSYGSRGVKPPIIYGNAEWAEPMTVDILSFASSLTDKTVKGMLTGPVTILNWSFLRTDLANEELLQQIGLAIEKEVMALEQAGIGIIQIDEPAFREGLPLKKHKQEAYLKNAVNAFRLTHSKVQNTTQIHTHMCYSEFNEIIEAISEMDADVISIEASRGGGEILKAFHDFHYSKDIGLGVYDIHSPRIPSVQEMTAVIKNCLKVLPAERFWVNPDCGLKTRTEEEVIRSLKHMTEAAQSVRDELALKL